MSFPIHDFIDSAREKGRSDEYVEECIVYINNLLKSNLPIIFSLEHLAILIKIQSNYLRVLIGDEKADFLIDHPPFKNKRYKKFSIAKRLGGQRIIMVPFRDLKFVQKWIAVNILSNVKLSDNCIGFVKGKSIVDNARIHEESKVILKVDLLKFYDSIHERRIYWLFKKLGYAPNLAFSLAKLCSYSHDKEYWDRFDNHSKEVFAEYIDNNYSILPQGAPTSPVIANIIATNLDRRIEGLSKKNGFNYSRYADDLTFSVTNEGKLPALNVIYKIIEQEGFFVNKDKTKYFYRGQKQYVTGLTTTHKVNVSKKYRKEIFSHLYYCRKYGVESHLAKNKEYFKKVTKLKFHDWLFGHICFINSVNKKASKEMFEEFSKIKWFD